jgi:hypothetical protein
MDRIGDHPDASAERPSRLARVLAFRFTALWAGLLAGSAVMAALLSLITHYIWDGAPLLTLYAYGASAVALLCAVAASFRRRWPFTAIYLAPACVMLVLLDSPGARAALAGAGARARIALTGQFLPTRESATFVEDGQRLELQRLESPDSIAGDEQIHYILRDTSGQIERDPALRSTAWKQAMETLPMGRVIAGGAFRVTRICGAYYDIVFSLNDTEG